MTSIPPWNRALAGLPDACDVLVVGAGPAGSACARVLAQAGLQVLLVDGQAFPRDKVCGDGLVPDSHAALRRLGVLDEVLRAAVSLADARCVAPCRQAIDVPGELAVLPRRVLDAIVCRAAVDAGATMAAPARFVAPLRDDAGRVRGATLSASGVTRDVAARWVVLATGATPAALLAAGMCERRAPSGMALRGYVRHPGLADEVKGMRFVWHQRLKGGYGWVFPGPDGVFNIGAGVLASHATPGGSQRRQPRPRNLRAMFDDFLAVDPIAARLAREGEWLGELKGAPMRFDLDGARWSAPGLLVTGEAAGATYSFTGEGIGKAMETGMAAADSLLAHDASGDEAVMGDYAARLQSLQPRFAMYRKAASFNRAPWLISVVIWRARRSPQLAAKLGDILNERRLPGTLLSWRGLRSVLMP